MPYHTLRPAERAIIEAGGTEAPFSGEYDALFAPGTYLCRRCHAPLYDAQTKFDAGCGWPAFDENFPDAVKRLADPDGRRTEIRCAHCDGHLGHVFEGEGLTESNTRHCVNSLAIRFIPAGENLPKILDPTP
jgi:peptide-methionine (R)-S-oxide reductase